MERPKDTLQGLEGVSSDKNATFRIIEGGQSDAKGGEGDTTLRHTTSTTYSASGELSEKAETVLEALREATPNGLCADVGTWERKSRYRGITRREFYPLAQELLEGGFVEPHKWAGDPGRALPQLFGLPGGGWTMRGALTKVVPSRWHASVGGRYRYKELPEELLPEEIHALRTLRDGEKPLTDGEWCADMHMPDEPMAAFMEGREGLFLRGLIRRDSAGGWHEVDKARTEEFFVEDGRDLGDYKGEVLVEPSYYQIHGVSPGSGSWEDGVFKEDASDLTEEEAAEVARLGLYGGMTYEQAREKVRNSR